MTEPDAQSPRGAGDGPSAGGMEGAAGQVIRAAREAQGQTLTHLSILLKISERRLQAFEDGRWDEVGDRTFVRALAQSLCRHLGLDPRPVLQALPAASAQPREQPDRGRLPESAPPRLKTLRQPGGSGFLTGAGIFTPVRLGVAVILAGALAMAFVPSAWWSPKPTPTGAEAVLPAPAAGSAPASASAPEAAASNAPSAVPSTASAPALEAPSTASAPGASVATLPPSVSPTASVSPVSPPSNPATAGAVPSAGGSAAAPLQIIARQDTWVQVSDARGQPILSRLLRSGEQVGLEGARPLRVRVGNAAGTEVVWQGRRVALDQAQRNNVADVELP